MRFVGAVIVALGVSSAPMVVGAQWLKYPTPNAPRLPNGKVDRRALPPPTTNVRVKAPVPSRASYHGDSFTATPSTS